MLLPLLKGENKFSKCGYNGNNVVTKVVEVVILKGKLSKDLKGFFT
jgi:hypothetical protein